MILNFVFRVMYKKLEIILNILFYFYCFDLVVLILIGALGNFNLLTP